MRTLMWNLCVARWICPRQNRAATSCLCWSCLAASSSSRRTCTSTSCMASSPPPRTSSLTGWPTSPSTGPCLGLRWLEAPECPWPCATFPKSSRPLSSWGGSDAWETLRTLGDRSGLVHEMASHCQDTNIIWTPKTECVYFMGRLWKYLLQCQNTYLSTGMWRDIHILNDAAL